MDTTDTILISATVSAIITLVITAWRLGTIHEKERATKLEQWYSQTAGLAWRIKWELRRMDGSISLDSRTGPSGFGELDESSEMAYIDELVKSLFEHAGQAPHEIISGKHSDEQLRFHNKIRDFVSSYLQIDPIPGDREVVIDTHREDWIAQLEEIRKRALSEMESAEPESLDFFRSLR